MDSPLSVTEWVCHALRLRDDLGATATLTKEDGHWMVRSTGGGYNELGVADCWVDNSH
jgi:hypothetical protein